MHVQREYVNCGNPRCRKGCNEGRYVHGPYWYGYWKERGKVRSVYLGKSLPAGHGKASSEPTREKPRDPPDRFSWDGRRMSSTDAMRILGLRTTDRASVDKAYRNLVKRHHPDRARSEAARREGERIMKAANAARSTLLR